MILIFCHMYSNKTSGGREFETKIGIGYVSCDSCLRLHIGKDKRCLRNRTPGGKTKGLYCRGCWSWRI